MDTTHETLGLEPGGRLTIYAFQLLDWGRVLRLDCRYRLSESESHTLALVFNDCREMKWRIYAFEDGRDEVALVDARLGRGGHRSPAQLLTDRFGLTLTYGELQVERGGNGA